MEIKKYAEESVRIAPSAPIGLVVSTPLPIERWRNENEDADDDDEALSLSDLPLIQHQSSEENEELPLPPPQHDFDFCSPSKQSEMRAADEIFFQGQIMPQYTLLQPNSSYRRSESMSSRHSSTSSGSSSAAAPPNLFHSHPSPSPRILSNERQLILRNNCVKKSWSWNVFRLGLIAAPPPEIAFRDLKTRCSGKNTSMSSGGGGEKKLRVKAWDLVGGCKKCSVDAVDVAEVSQRIAFMKRSASDGERRRRGDEENVAAMNVKPVNHRTFEWLKQLSIQGAAVGER